MRWWMLLPSWARVLGSMALWAAAAGVAVWQMSDHRAVITLLVALALMAVGGIAQALEERKIRRVPHLVGWGGDPKTFTRVRTDVDAGALPADPQLHDVASAYASHRLANPGPAWTGPPWLAFAIPLGYFVIAAVNTAMSAGYVVLGLAWLLLATMGYRRTHVLPPRWQRIVNTLTDTPPSGPVETVRHP